jgi:hypothetical protein
MSALAGIAPPEALADHLARCLGTTRVETCEHTQATRRSGVKSSLSLVIWDIRITLLQPVADGRLEDGGNRHFVETRLPFQVRFKLYG